MGISIICKRLEAMWVKTLPSALKPTPSPPYRIFYKKVFLNIYLLTKVSATCKGWAHVDWSKQWCEFQNPKPRISCDRLFQPQAYFSHTWKSSCFSWISWSVCRPEEKALIVRPLRFAYSVGLSTVAKPVSLSNYISFSHIMHLVLICRWWCTRIS